MKTRASIKLEALFLFTAEKVRKTAFADDSPDCRPKRPFGHTGTLRA
jgi:hypothetical protein